MESDGPKATGAQQVSTRGRIADLADVVAPADEQKIAAALAAGEQRDGRKVMVVTLAPASGDSLERVGWAVRGTGSDQPLLLLIDPAKRAVRVEGDVDPPLKAEAARLVRAGLAEGRLGERVVAAVAILERS